MQDTTPGHTTRQVSVAEAARELKVSAETIRRYIKAGRLQAERAIRPQGTIWLVSLPDTTPRGVPPLMPQTSQFEVSFSKAEHAPSAEALHPSARHTEASGDAARLVASIARLIVELAEVRVISDRRADQLLAQAGEIADLREERGKLAAEVDHLRDVAQVAEAKQASILAAQTVTSSSEPAVTVWRRWWPAALALAGVGAVVMALWPS